ncbi:hypothetical protein E2C01_036395 [Portunus trituberculatus]|uniref:Uncharacterized protein n=1 Tax=Portunus trituberculatus TaxID=210409 RepID=A0A5B7FCC1_PORTR|nr:hypothetical protein [Portunus trituberculatus]
MLLGRRGKKSLITISSRRKALVEGSPMRLSGGERQTVQWVVVFQEKRKKKRYSRKYCTVKRQIIFPDVLNVKSEIIRVTSLDYKYDARCMTGAANSNIIHLSRGVTAY